MLRIAKKKVKKKSPGLRLDPNPDIAVLNHSTLNFVPSISDINCLSSFKVLRIKNVENFVGLRPRHHLDIGPLAFSCLMLKYK